MIFNIAFDTSSRKVSLTSVTDRDVDDTYAIQTTYDGPLREGYTAYCVLENGTNIELVDGYAEIPVFDSYLVLQLKFVWEDERFYSMNLLVLKESDIIKS